MYCRSLPRAGRELTSYEYKGKKFYICDPTYIGAKIGKCMPSYAKESPQIEVWY